MAATATTNPQTAPQKAIAQQQQSQYATQNGMKAPGTAGSGAPAPVQGSSPVTPTGQIAPQPVGGQASPSLGGTPAPAPTPQITPAAGNFQGGTGVQDMPTQALAQQQMVPEQQVNPYQTTQFQQSGLVNPTEQALQSAISGQMYDQNAINTMKGANKSTALNAMKQFGGANAQAAAARGLQGGVVDAGNRAAQQEALKQVITGNNAIDMGAIKGNFDAQMQAIGAGQQQQQLGQQFQQAQAGENQFGFNAGLQGNEFNLKQGLANAGIGQQNAAQALDAWKAYNGQASTNKNAADALAVQSQLGNKGIDTDLALGKGSQAISLLGTLMNNNQASNSLGYQYSALNAAQQQAMMQAILGR
jgi:hypothetical protein